MPTYTLKAPNGKTYDIEGPAGATEDQVRAEILRRDPNAGNKPEGYGGALKRGLYNLPRSGVELLKSGMQQFGPEGLPAQAVMHPVKTYEAGKEMAGKAADILTGGLQHVREMSPEAQRGNAPRMDTTAFDKTAGNYDSGQKIASRIADDPAGAVIGAASVVAPALKGLQVGKIVDALGVKSPKLPTPRLPAVAEKYISPRRRAEGAADRMRGESNAEIINAQGAAEDAVTASTTRAQRLQALAERQKARAGQLDERRTAAVAETAAPELVIGQERHLSEMGDSLREPAVARQGEINTAMREADDTYRKAMESVAADRAAAGVGVGDTKSAKALLKASKDKVQPDPARRPDVGSTLADSAGGKLHTQVIEALSDRQVPLSKTAAVRARKNGHKVYNDGNGEYYRIIKPDLEAVDNVRRFLGKVLDGKIEGYEAVNRIEAAGLYRGVSDVIDEYVKGASKPVQQNWAAGKKALEPFENVRAGQTLTGTQAGTDVASVPASSIPGRALAGGRDTMEQTARVAGQAPVIATLRSQVQNAFKGAKTADEIEALVKPGTTLGDAANADKTLMGDISDYAQRLRASEVAAAKADELASRMTNVRKRAGKLTEQSEKATAAAAKARETTQAYERKLIDLSIAEPKDVGALYLKMLDDPGIKGRISPERYERGVKLAASAEKDFATRAQRNKWLRRAALLAGLASVPTVVGPAMRAFGR